MCDKYAEMKKKFWQKQGTHLFLQPDNKNGRFVYRLGQPPFTGQRRVRFPYRLHQIMAENLINKGFSHFLFIAKLNWGPYWVPF